MKKRKMKLNNKGSLVSFKVESGYMHCSKVLVRCECLGAGPPPEITAENGWPEECFSLEEETFCS